jgi:EAL domain-containing protein (putative c-di-GMP-specific phosphodiesterase class I)
VETKEELETLCKMDVDYVQGYYISKPGHELKEPDKEVMELIKKLNFAEKDVKV